VAYDAGPSPIGNDRGPGLACIQEQVSNISIAAWIGDSIGKRTDATTTQGNPIRQALAPAMADPITRIIRHQRMEGKPGRGDFGDH
jgi:hypothetical protein